MYKWEAFFAKPLGIQPPDSTLCTVTTKNTNTMLGNTGHSHIPQKCLKINQLPLFADL